MSAIARLQLGLAAVLIAALAFGAGYFFAGRGVEVRSLPAVAGIVWPPPPPLEAFELIDADGRRFDETQLDRHWTLLFFGYTQCPDICPTTMATLKGVDAALADLAAYREHGQVLFVSVDEVRDTPAQLKRYAGFFNPQFLAASAAPEPLHRLTRQFGARIVRVSGDDPDEYWFDHPASVLLIGPDRRVVGDFVPPLDAADIAAQVRAIIEYSVADS